MKALRLMLFSFLFLAIISLSRQKENLLPENDVCRLLKDGTRIRKPGTCNEGVVCRNFKSIQGAQCGKQWYNIDSKDDSKACVNKQPSDKYCQAPCALTSPKFVADKKSCNGWYQCNGKKEVNKGICPANQIFSQKQQMCTYDAQCVATYDFCDVVPKDTLIADENNCHKYFQCTRSVKGGITLQSITCPEGTYFDRAVGKCDTKTQVDCYRHPYPENVCGDKKIAYRNRFVSDGATCRGYFFCRDLGVGVPDPAPQWGQCPPSEFFNPVQQTCEQRSHIKCREDRCDGRLDGQLELSGDKYCQHYLVCGNGYTKEKRKCPDAMYFDVEQSTCTTTRKQYPACA